MKKVLFILIMLLGVVFTTQAQDVELTDELESVLKVDTVRDDPMFVANPRLHFVANFDNYGNAKQLQYDYESFDRVWDYQRKQTREMCIGLGIGAVGIAGMIYAVNMPTPTRQVNNPALDPAADEARRDRRIVGVSSIVVGTIGGVIFARSFRWTKRIKAEVGLQSLRLEYRLTGNRRYFQGKKVKKLKRLGLYPRYRN
jgi:hypothetical protein